MFKASFLAKISRNSYRQPGISWFSAAARQSTGSYTQVQENNGVREIILSDVKTRNSLTFAMMDALQRDLTNNQNSEQLRCIVLSAQGAVWSSGHNLKELHASAATERAEAFKKLVDVIKCIRQHPVPIIAKVNGVAAAAGVQLMASCDMVVSSKNSKFSTPGVKFGIFCSTPGIALARVMLPLRASYMLFTGNEISAQEALEAGLISRLADNEEQLNEQVNQIAAQILAKSRAVVALGKQFFYQQLEMGYEDAYEKGVKTMVKNLEMPDGQEGVNSFIEKRSPVWSHK